MKEDKITFEQLSITPEEVYKAMGYGTQNPEADIQQLVKEALQEIATFTVARFAYVRVVGVLNRDTLLIGNTPLNIGKIIGKQLAGSEAFILFVATAGEAFNHWLEASKEDIVRHFIAHNIGSCLAEAAANYMELCLQEELNTEGLLRTNRFSPGYCGWQVSEQQKLFSLFPVEEPCGVQLTESSLMMPIKSVSGVIGIGSNVRRLEYTCGLCELENCYKKKNTNKGMEFAIN